MKNLTPLKIIAGYNNNAGTLEIVLATRDGKLFENGTTCASTKAGEISALIKKARPNVGDTILLPLESRSTVFALIVSEDQTEASLESLGESIVKLANSKDFATVSLILEDFGLDAEVVAGKLAYGAQIASNRYTLKSDAKAASLSRLYFFKTDEMPAVKTVQNIIDTASKTAMGSVLMRNLIQMPPNVLGTRQLLEAAQMLESLDKRVDVKVTKITKGSKMGAMYAVGQVSSQDSLLIEIRYEGDANAPLTALVGKGLVYDTGGINIKPNGGKGMKGDMGGSAMVLGTMHAAISRGEKVNLIGVIGAVCNDIGPDAYRPDDVLTAYNGKTIEVGNTDAEGRLVLADCLSYTEEKYSPKRIFSFATLTGAAVVAHGRRAPIFSDNYDFVSDMVEAARTAGEMVAHVPMDDYLKPLLNSKIADTSNISAGRMCGHTTAAIFLNKFVANTPYLHVDIAGASDIDGPGEGAFGVPMMLQYLTAYAQA